MESNPKIIDTQESAYKLTALGEDQLFDIVIIGGGPAGLTAAVYCLRKGFKTALLTVNIGGQMLDTYSIENYMGYRYIEGSDLVSKFTEQIKEFELTISENIKVKNIVPGNPHQIFLENSKVCFSSAIIVASGKSPRKLNTPGEKKLTGRGVAYSLTTEGPFFQGKKVTVIGGGNSGVEACLDLSRICEAITLVQSGDKLTADRVLVEKICHLNNVQVLCNYEVVEIIGENRVEAITLRDKNSYSDFSVDSKGVFVQIGLEPNTSFAEGVLKLNSHKEIEIDCSCATDVPGIFAAGDATNVPFKQIIIAAGEGAKAALSACEYVLNL